MAAPHATATIEVRTDIAEVERSFRNLGLAARLLELLRLNPCRCDMCAKGIGAYVEQWIRDAGQGMVHDE